MEKDTQNMTEETAERLRQFHEQSKRQPKEPMHSDGLLAVCAIILGAGGVIGSFFALNGFEMIISAFLSFTSGVLLYTIARIYATLREIRDNQK